MAIDFRVSDIIVLTYTPSTGDIVTVSAAANVAAIVDTDTIAEALAKGVLFGYTISGFTSTAADTVEVALSRA